MENNGLGSHWPGAEPSPRKGTFPAPSVRAWATGPSQDFRKVIQQQTVPLVSSLSEMENLL